jgi:hypothetical protein
MPPSQFEAAFLPATLTDAEVAHLVRVLIEAVVVSA